MPTLHLLPGESPGETADIVLNCDALSLLEKLVARARRDGYACDRFTQRDGQPYTLCIEVIHQGKDHPLWRETPLSYHPRNRRTVITDAHQRGFDMAVVAAHFRAARKLKGHNQTAAAKDLGVSTGWVHNVEHCETVPKPGNFARLLSYIGTETSLLSPVGR